MVDGDSGGAASPLNGSPPQIPPPGPIGPFPAWIPVVGAIFGAVTLSGLLILVWVAGQNPTFVCNSFTFLAPVFSLGAALAASFIGGAAAFQGQLGQRAKENAFIVTASGGVAVLLAVLVIFALYKPSDCDLAKTADHLMKEISDLQETLTKYENRDVRITPEAYNQPRLLADRMQLHYINRDREDITLSPTLGAFVIKMQDIDAGSTITIGPRPSLEVARPLETGDTATPTVAPTRVELSSLKYLSMPSYIELQLYLNVGER